MIANDVVGTIDFKAGDSDGSDAILVCAGIEAVAEAAFTASANKAKLSFKTAESEAASEKMSLSSGGNLSLPTDEVQINLGADADVTIKHVPDEGLIIENHATGDNKPVKITLKSEEDNITADEVIGAIDFKGGDSGGTDAILVCAGIEAVAEEAHTSSVNKARLVFKTGASETATEKMRLTSGGDLSLPTDGSIISIGATDGNSAVTSAADLSQLNLGDTYWNGTSGDTVKLKLWDGQAASADEFMGIGAEGNRLVFVNSNQNFDWRWQIDDTVKLTLDGQTGDLLMSGELQTAAIGYTDGDNAITIADGGGITAANGITSTAASNTFGATSFNDADITNVGDINADSISVDAAGTGLNVDFSGGNTGTNAITLGDNLADSLSVKEGSNVYMTFVTTDGQEHIQIPDDRILGFGSDTDITVQYDEDGDDALVVDIGAGASGGFQISSAASANAVLTVKNTQNNTDGSTIKLVNDRAHANISDGNEICGTLNS